MFLHLNELGVYLFVFILSVIGMFASQVNEPGAYFFVFTLSIVVMFVIVSILNTIVSCSKEDNSVEEDPSSILQALRLKNVDRIIFGQLNICSVRNKIPLLSDIITNRVDIMLVTETHINESFPMSQLLINGFSEPLRLDRTDKGGGILLYIRNDIPTKELKLISGKIECILVELTISKKKWLVIS